MRDTWPERARGGNPAVSHCKDRSTARIPRDRLTTLETEMNKLQPMAANTQATLRTFGKGETVEVTFTVKENGEKDTARYNLVWSFDFANVTADEVRKLATRSLRIDGQSTWRKARNKMDADIWQDKKWSVRAMLDQTKQKADPTQKVLNAAAKMTKAERRVLIDLLAADV